MLVLHHDSQVPLYTQLYKQLKDAVLAGRLASHARLPSVRDLASQLSVSRNTVENAYLELYAEGYIYSKARSGYFVAPLAEGLEFLQLPREASTEEDLVASASRHGIRLFP